MPELTLEEITIKVSEKLRPLILEDVKTVLKENMQPPAPTEPPQIHDLKEFEPYCSACHLPNEKYTGPAKYRCKTCKRPLGNDADVEKLEKCPYPPCEGDTVEPNTGYLEG